MKANYTDISIVLDRSGSMESTKDDTIGGFNSFLEGQKKVPGEATLTLVQFDHDYDVVFEALDLPSAPRLTKDTFVPRGSTALLDAIGRTINATGKRLATMDEANRPEKVIFVILTDGCENASREFDVQKINDMIRHQQDVYKWEFVFLAANQDAITSASKIGIAAHNSLTYAANALGTRRAYTTLEAKISSARMNKSARIYFDEQDRNEQKQAGA